MRVRQQRPCAEVDLDGVTREKIQSHTGIGRSGRHVLLKEASNGGVTPLVAVVTNQCSMNGGSLDALISPSADQVMERGQQ